MSVTIKDIAEAVHVSPAAVSLALNGKPGISENVRKQILQTAEELHYSRRSEKRISEKPSIRYVIYVSEGSVVLSISFHSLVLKGIEKRAQELGYNVLISYLYENQMMEQQLRELQQNVRGILMLATEFDEDSPLCEALCRINQEICPVILLDYLLIRSPIDCIATDNFNGAYQAISYLAGQGHQKIGYFTSFDYISNFGERSRGVDAAAKAAENVALTRVPTRFSTKNAYTDIYDWAKKQDPDNLPTAFFADSDIIAFGALQAFSRLDIRVPEDISIMGFDDMPECDMILPALTTIHVAKETMGSEGMRLMNRRIRERTVPKQIDPADQPPLHMMISTSVKERNSVLPRP
ncbi:MAG: LacI family DNA-binding transcriptional regulator [Eubacterium sp.]|nr:LacI family DNA-binding transcriptional regulator [Eubacterium sp.]